ncbi:hypothetical protein HELRODRAFT_159564 [Helobdella robusta]|uniref:Uncharacterized protein n=1 Tax=Helobdella robusta TaxID=6412 RepID=T1EP61_HELRO|nr:hypothetical protein HELRODRAFT_159564 [Helobdella robusta]ESO12969.1 hypothetical protein HELRODRAFT_159564 [Helobdella robusta]
MVYSKYFVLSAFYYVYTLYFLSSVSCNIIEPDYYDQWLFENSNVTSRDGQTVQFIDVIGGDVSDVNVTTGGTTMNDFADLSPSAVVDTAALFNSSTSAGELQEYTLINTDFSQATTATQTSANIGENLITSGLNASSTSKSTDLLQLIKAGTIFVANQFKENNNLDNNQAINQSDFKLADNLTTIVTPQLLSIAADESYEKRKFTIFDNLTTIVISQMSEINANESYEEWNFVDDMENRTTTSGTPSAIMEIKKLLSEFYGLDTEILAIDASVTTAGHITNQMANENVSDSYNGTMNSGSQLTEITKITLNKSELTETSNFTLNNTINCSIFLRFHRSSLCNKDFDVSSAGLILIVVVGLAFTILLFFCVMKLLRCYNVTGRSKYKYTVLTNE